MIRIKAISICMVITVLIIMISYLPLCAAEISETFDASAIVESLLRAYVNDRQVTIYVPNGVSGVVTITVLHEDDDREILNKNNIKSKAIYIYQTNESQLSPYTFKMPNSALSGRYTISLNNGSDQPLEITIDYFSSAEKNSIIDNINSIVLINDKTAFAQLLLNTSNRDILKYLGLEIDDYLTLGESMSDIQTALLTKSNYTEATLKEEFNRQTGVALLRNADALQFKGKIEHYSQILNVDMSNISLYMSLIESGNEAGVYSILENAIFNTSHEFNAQLRIASVVTNFNIVRNYGNFDVLITSFGNEIGANVTAYQKLSKTNKVLVQKALLVGGFKDYYDIELCLSDAINAIPNVPEDNGKGGGGGGGGGFSPIIPIVSIPEVEFEKTPDDVETKLSFSDLEDVEYARNSIMFLAGKGVLSGMGDGTFNPNESVTREQFVKMLMLALNKVDETAVCYYTDTPKNIWYYPYVASASKSRMIMGVGNGLFGAGEVMTRQEVAVIIYRACKSEGFIFVPSESKFSDTYQMADWAKNEIGALSVTKIINGIDKDTFAPLNITTRAQAAHIIYSTLERLGEVE